MINSNRPGVAASRADIDDHMLRRDARMLGGDLVKHPMEQPIGHFHNIVFGEATDPLNAPSGGQGKPITHQPFGAGAADQLQALHDLIGLPMLNPGVEVFLILPNDQQVKIGMLGGNNRVQRPAGADIGEETQAFPQGNIHAFIPAALGGGDRPFQHQPRAGKALPGFRRQTARVARLIAGFADGHGLRRQARARCLKNCKGCRHDFWADAVAGGDGDRQRCRGGGGKVGIEPGGSVHRGSSSAKRCWGHFGGGSKFNEIDYGEDYDQK